MPARQLHDANLDGRSDPGGDNERDRCERSARASIPLFSSTRRYETNRIRTHLSTTPEGISAEIAEGMIDAIDSEKFDHCLPDMDAVIELKTWDMDGFLVGKRARSGQPAAQRRPCRSELRPTRARSAPHRGRTGNGARRDSLRPARLRRPDGRLLIPPACAPPRGGSMWLPRIRHPRGPDADAYAPVPSSLNFS
jgi:hypothetical protein